MGSSTEYCISFQLRVGDGVIHRSWNPRKADSCNMGRALKRMGAERVAVCSSSTGEIAWEANKGDAVQMF